MTQTLPATVSPGLEEAIATLARRYRRANGPVMQVMNRLGGSLENQLDLLPASFRDQLETVTARALEAAYGLARHTPDLGQRGPVAAVMVSGAAGGAGGLATALAKVGGVTGQPIGRSSARAVTVSSWSRKERGQQVQLVLKRPPRPVHHLHDRAIRAR